MWSFVFFFKQKTAYEVRISDWSSDVCSSDLLRQLCRRLGDAGAVHAYRLSERTAAKGIGSAGGDHHHVHPRPDAEAERFVKRHRRLMRGIGVEEGRFEIGRAHV